MGKKKVGNDGGGQGIAHFISHNNRYGGRLELKSPSKTLNRDEPDKTRLKKGHLLSLPYASHGGAGLRERHQGRDPQLRQPQELSQLLSMHASTRMQKKSA